MEKFALRMFWIFMLLTALGVLINIWLGDTYLPEHAPTFFKIPATTFIIGFASFLIWAPIMVYRFLAKR